MSIVFWRKEESQQLPEAEQINPRLDSSYQRKLEAIYKSTCADLNFDQCKREICVLKRKMDEDVVVTSDSHENNGKD